MSPHDLRDHLAHAVLNPARRAVGQPSGQSFAGAAPLRGPTRLHSLGRLVDLAGERVAVQAEHERGARVAEQVGDGVNRQPHGTDPGRQRKLDEWTGRD